MSTASLYRRITRRETTSPRATLAIIVAVVVILASAYAVTEIVLGNTGQPPLITTPGVMLDTIATLPSVNAAALATGGAIVALLGLVLMIAALTAGRRNRHVLRTDRIATVVDDEVIASALARTAARNGNVSPDSARVSVSRRRAVVRLTPASGTAVPRQVVDDAAAAQLAAFELTPPVTSRVVLEKAEVGA